jgi:hypothetical protein
MQGHTITCVQGWDVTAMCGTAVKITGSPSLVRSSTPTTPSTILGSWYRGVDCQLHSSAVTGITFTGFWGEGAQGAAIYLCQLVGGNIINGMPAPYATWYDDYPAYIPWSANCIVHQSITTNDDRISGNRIDGCSTAIRRTAGGSQPLTIIANNINCRDISPPLTGRRCIDMFSSIARPALVRDNVITGDSRGAVIAANSTGVTYANNICKYGLAGCQSCVSQGQCVANGTSTSP